MKLLEKKDYPDWLKAASFENEVIYIDEDNRIHWYGGDWLDGDWCGGVWHWGVWHSGTWRSGDWLDGTWKGGTWRRGLWKDGVWLRGVWRRGLWKGGNWLGGTWLGGTWKGGIWKGGNWQDPIIKDRLLYMCSLIGIVFDADDAAKAYRLTDSETSYLHKEGYSEDDSGVLVTSMAKAISYFGVDQYAVLWEITFKRKDLLYCDGQIARVRAGHAKAVKCPFM